MVKNGAKLQFKRVKLLLSLVVHFTFEQILESLEDQNKGVVADEAGGHTIYRFYRFRLIGSEQSVPEHEHSSEVFINILFVRSMMDPMGGRCCQETFDDAQFADGLCV